MAWSGVLVGSVRRNEQQCRWLARLQEERQQHQQHGTKDREAEAHREVLLVAFLRTIDIELSARARERGAREKRCNSLHHTYSWSILNTMA